MGRAITSALMGLVLLGTSGAAVPAPMPQADTDQGAARYSDDWQQPGRGLCRRAGPLPMLAPEAQTPQIRPVPISRPIRRGRIGRPEPMPAPPVVMEAPVVDSPPPPPPPAPMPASPEPGTASPEIAVTGSAVGKAGSSEAGAPVASARVPADSRATMPWPGRPPRWQPEPQAGLLTAGEHDDLLNPELYARYVARYLGQQQEAGVPRLDTARTLTIAVNDGAGRPVPFANVTLTCADGNTLSLTTLADGTAVFFPGYDRLGSSVRARVGGQNRIVDLGSAGVQRVAFTTGSSPDVRKFDLMLMIDTTGSMGDEIAYLKTELASILNALKRSHPGLDIRLGLVAYRDIGDEYVTRSFAFSSDLSRTQGVLAALNADGGGDYPEAVDQALIRAVGMPGWRPDAVKSLLFVADAPPHDNLIARSWRAADVARAKRIQIVPVAASGVADKAEYVMRAMAAATQSRYIFLTDDSGIGNPHAPPAIDCYLVTRLNTMVRRVLDSQISGRRIEPAPQDVIRTVGNYDAGRCILPRGWDQQQGD